MAKASIGYKFKNGNKTSHGVSAKDVAEHLEHLRLNNDGALLARAVVEDARAGSILHPFIFGINDQDAAEAHRLDLARQLISSVEIVYLDRGNDERTVRAFVNLLGDGPQHYTSTAVAMDDATKRALVIKQAFAELELFRKRYEDYIEFAEIWDAMSVVRTRIPRTSRRSASASRHVSP